MRRAKRAQQHRLEDHLASTSALANVYELPNSASLFKGPGPLALSSVPRLPARARIPTDAVATCRDPRVSRNTILHSPRSRSTSEPSHSSEPIGCFDAVKARAHINALLTVAAHLEESVVQSVANTTTVRLVWRCFSSWKFSRARARLAVLELSFERRRKNRLISLGLAGTVFAAWVGANRGIRVVAIKYKASFTGPAFSAWRCAALLAARFKFNRLQLTQVIQASQSRRKQELIQSCATRWRVFRAWSRKREAAKKLRARVLLCLGFSTWRTQHRAHGLVEKRRARHLLFQSSHCIATWATYTRQEHRLAEFVRRHSTRAVRGLVGLWRTATTAVRTLPRLARFLRGMSKRRHQRRILRFWSAVACLGPAWPLGEGAQVLVRNGCERMRTDA